MDMSSSRPRLSGDSNLLAVTSPIRMKLAHVPAGEFLMGSTLAKGREASKGEPAPSTELILSSSTSASIR